MYDWVSSVCKEYSWQQIISSGHFLYLLNTVGVERVRNHMRAHIVLAAGRSSHSQSTLTGIGLEGRKGISPYCAAHSHPTELVQKVILSEVAERSRRGKTNVLPLLCSCHASPKSANNVASVPSPGLNPNRKRFKWSTSPRTSEAAVQLLSPPPFLRKWD